MRITIAYRSPRLLATVLVLTLACGRAKADGACDFSHDAPDEKLYQLHTDGSIFVKNDQACSESACFGGWFLLDNNQATAAIASYCELYQMHTDGSIYHYTGKGTAQDQCDGGFCGNWQQLDQNQQTKTIAVGDAYFATNAPPFLYQMHNDGSIYRKNGNDCADPACFGGWDQLDANPSTVAITAGFNGLYQLHNDGTVYRWDGKTPCDAKGCVGWALLDQNPATAAISAGHGFYQMHTDGSIFRYIGAGESCVAAPCPNWVQVGQDSGTSAIKAGFSGFYRLRQDGQILQKSQASCGGTVCLDDWTVLDQHSSTKAMTAGRNLYQMRSDGSIFRFNGTPCGTPGCDAAWDQLDANPATAGIVVNGTLSLH
jgi:ribosomal protein L24E